MHVLLATATSEFLSSWTSQARKTVLRPPFLTSARAVSRPVQTGLRKLILSSRVVKDSPAAEHASVERAHGVGVPPFGFELQNGAAFVEGDGADAEQLCDRRRKATRALPTHLLYVSFARLIHGGGAPCALSL
jgi:hypothetical protein